MPRTAHRFVAFTGKVRGITATALSVTLIALMTAIPTGQASAASGAKPTINIPTENLSSIFPSLPVSDLGLTSTELEQALSRVEGLHGLAHGELATIVSGLLAKDPNATMQELVEGVLGNSTIGTLLKSLGLGLQPDQVLNALNQEELTKLLENVTSTLNNEQLAKLLGSVSGKLDPEQLGALQGILSALMGNLSGSELTKLKEDLTTLLSGLSKGELELILKELKGLLGSGTGATQVEALLNELKTHLPSGLSPQLEALLNSLNSTQLAELLDSLFGQLKSSQLETVLGDLLGGLPLSTTNAGALAENLKMPVSKIGEQLDSGVSSTTPVLSAALGKEGPVLGMIGEASGLKLGVLGGENAAKGGNGGNGGSGNGSNGGSGSNAGTSGQSTIVVVISPTNGAGARTSVSKALARIKIVSHKVKGHVATFVVQVPSAGNVSLSGAHVTKVTRKAARAGRLTLKVRLTRAGLASLHRHRGLLRVNLIAYFKPKSGRSSSATASVRFL